MSLHARVTQVLPQEAVFEDGVRQDQWATVRLVVQAKSSTAIFLKVLYFECYLPNHAVRHLWINRNGQDPTLIRK